MNPLKGIITIPRSILIQLMLAAVLMGVAVIGQSYLIVIIVDRIFLQEDPFAAVIPLLGVLLLMLVLRVGVTYWNGRLGTNLAARVKQDLRQALVAKYTKNSVESMLEGQSGKKVSVLLDSVDEMDSYYSQYMPKVIQTSIVPLMVLIAAFSYDWVTGLVMMITAPFIPLFYIVIGIMTQNRADTQLEKMNAFSGTFLDTLQGLTTLKLFGRAKAQQDVIERSSLDFRDATLTVLKLAFLSSLMLEFISMLSMGMIALEVSLRLILFQSITFVPAFLMLVLAPEYYLALKEMGAAFHTGRGSVAAAKQIAAELTEDDRSVVFGQTELPAARPPRIELKDVAFSYRDARFAMTELNLAIEPYQKVALIGRSGAGKSTVLQLLAGLADPQDGQLLLDGQPRQMITEASWFRQLSYISQHPYLYAGTLAENIAIGELREASRSAIEQAASDAGLTELIGQLPNGLDTVIGEGGRGLSGGEKQRVALARAFLKRPNIILFDEPTTGLDVKTERLLQEAITVLGREATVITVAHRLHTIEQSDQIVILEAGRIVDRGTHEELMGRESEYAMMRAVQRGEETR
ncbi:thiol reductant ABC exporter subunit CydD [Exiguobacterium antarcticum]|uniref:Thiol reductant ABC exporter subunit CydD n=1 Tax=Exiguobacterium antarcticum TaxID=132920 RepID=A0ABT6R3M3_9BACL|nr:thiol reductant ABC exporter subunit CydD [Exiguobacterium antarcticum]MDI3234884.1 thiol reductant ABC exporter subunit CydD [Exiguobacterium antarcticum]